MKHLLAATALALTIASPLSAQTGQNPVEDWLAVFAFANLQIVGVF